MSWLLDTDVICQPAKRNGDKRVAAWLEDSYIAATAKRYGLTVVTGNDPDFRRPGLKVFNTFKELA